MCIRWTVGVLGRPVPAGSSATMRYTPRWGRKGTTSVAEISTCGGGLGLEEAEGSPVVRRQVVGEPTQFGQMTTQGEEVVDGLVDRVAHQIAHDVADPRPLVQGPGTARTSRQAGVDAHRCPRTSPGSWYCSGMWSSWCHARYDRSSPVGERCDSEKKPTLTRFTGDFRSPSGAAIASSCSR